MHTAQASVKRCFTSARQLRYEPDGHYSIDDAYPPTGGFGCPGHIIQSSPLPEPDYREGRSLAVKTLPINRNLILWQKGFMPLCCIYCRMPSQDTGDETQGVVILF